MILLDKILLIIFYILFEGMGLIDKLISLQIIKKENQDLYEYSLKILKGYIFFLIILILINIYTKNYLLTIVYLICFFSLRRYTGGFHLERKFKCLLFSIFLSVMIPFISEYIFLGKDLLIYVQFIVSLIIVFFPIIDSPQKYVSELEKKYYKKRVLLVLGLYFFINLLFDLKKYSIMILFAIITSFFSILFGFIKYKLIVNRIC
ncbi:accessory gene regulator B family protein [Thomasclavelia sp.]|uniref:accessory gene regulator B family protein n=1 Tax=Thomasclavelia sp. TaxID=3025757 RepID=UPI0025FBF1B6|nr:accessory gene regulator B family protein [Thomasclavelia sp.]